MIEASIGMGCDWKNDEAGFAIGVQARIGYKEYSDSTDGWTFATGICWIAPSLIWVCLRRWLFDFSASWKHPHIQVTAFGFRPYIMFEQKRLCKECRA